MCWPIPEECFQRAAAAAAERVARRRAAEAWHKARGAVEVILDEGRDQVLGVYERPTSIPAVGRVA